MAQDQKTLTPHHPGAMIRNPRSHRHTAANAKRTEQRVEQFYGKVALLETWESQPEQILADEHEYILELRATIRNIKNYLLHRADPNAKI